MKNFNAKLIKANESLKNKGNKDWWENNPMTYDWKKELGEPSYTKKWFKSIDEIFGEGHSLLNNPRWPKGFILEKFIPYSKFSGKNILEIGCGSGLLSSHIAKAGGNLFAVDITNKAVETTKKRFDLEGLKGSIQQMDAEKLTFEKESMDYVISWGVIHHSGNMEAIIDQIHKVLKPGGKAFLMVYNRHSIRFQIYCKFWLGIMKLKFLKMNLNEIVGRVTDGYIARHVTKKEFSNLTKDFNHAKYSISDEKTTILKYLFGLGKPFKLTHFITRHFEKWLARRGGWYLEVVLTK